MHSEDRKVKKASDVVIASVPELMFYTSNSVVASCRYDVPLGMPRLVANDPKIEYSKQIVKVD